jgi:catechol 2,3-dioxygenase-like lactoylglutathione lyase family enzyme
MAPTNASAACLAAGFVLLAASLAPAEPPRRPRITGLAHVAVYVQDMEKARTYYRDLLGYEEPYEIRDAAGTLAVAFVKINDRQYLELFPEREKGSDRLAHLAFETEDVEALRAWLAAQGVAVPEAAPRGRIGNRSFSVKDPEGHQVELVQYEPDGWTAREKGRALGPDRASASLRHAGILTGALAPALRFYSELLGFEETWRGSREGRQLDWVNLRVPDGTDYVELMLYAEPPAPGNRGSQHHICLEVPDIPAAAVALEARAGRAGYTRPLQVRTGINRKRQLNLFDPDGTRTELMEPQTIDGKPTPSSTAPPPTDHSRGGL